MKSRLVQRKWRFYWAALTLCILMVGSCVQSNNLPVISKVQPEKDWVTPSGKNIIVCVASDADDDSLTYAWSATGGTFSGAGPVVTWMAPNTPGTYALTVTVTDGRGGEVSSQLTMDVLVNHAPVIESLIAEPPAVKQGGRATLKCVASDPDGDTLNYEWVAARGNISGQGFVVTWTAPNACDEYVIKVTVSDIKGSEASEELKIRVEKPG